MGPPSPTLHQMLGPNSPPDTPRNTSPSQEYRQRHHHHQQQQQQQQQQGTGTQQTPTGLKSSRAAGSRPMSQTPNIKPTGHGHQFSYTRPDHQLSPRSSGSSMVPSDSDSDTQSSIGPGPFSSDCPLPSIERTEAGPPPQDHVHEIHIHHHDEVKQPVRIVAYASTEVNFTLEELQSDYDPEDSDTEDLSIMRPHAIEYPQSEGSQSHSRGRVDSRVMNSFTRLGMDDLSDESDDGSEYMDTETHRRIIQKIREQKRRRRMTSGSIGKRTITESIGSDTDNEDVLCFLGADEVGSSARRLRRKYERHSFIFQDPPPPRIDEMDEPVTTDDDDDELEVFGKELPYWTMEIDSS